MNKTSVAITAAFCVAIGFLIARSIETSDKSSPKIITNAWLNKA